MSKNKFSQLTTARKGAFGEELVVKILNDMGCTVYTVDESSKDKTHPIDIMVMHRKKMKLFCADVKTKRQRDRYPDTGININHFGEYKFIQDVNDVPVYLFFVDEYSREIYGNYLDKLCKPITVRHGDSLLNYPRKEKGIVFFAMDAMHKIGTISEEDAKKLESLSSRKWVYEESEIEDLFAA